MMERPCMNASLCCLRGTRGASLLHGGFGESTASMQRESTASMQPVEMSAIFLTRRAWPPGSRAGFACSTKLLRVSLSPSLSLSLSLKMSSITLDWAQLECVSVSSSTVRKIRGTIALVFALSSASFCLPRTGCQRRLGGCLKYCWIMARNSARSMLPSPSRSAAAIISIASCSSTSGKMRLKSSKEILPFMSRSTTRKAACVAFLLVARSSWSIKALKTLSSMAPTPSLSTCTKIS
mmetsp:Transcript_136432/g.323116  ORF Transcript_136432/g.323116 Transcript_136432/m.323116 type:complete len:237 (-) Transcript_136432:1068-1778(-)